ncbi:MAG: FdtA/QdtA family cupin domain-containing protein [Lysobacterales bacterium]
MSVDSAQLVSLPKIADPRGNLSFIEAGRPVPFAIKRSYWIYDVPGGETRGGHAYRSLQECFIALSGSFDVHLDDGERKRRVSLNRSYLGLVVPRLLWRRLDNFSTNAVCLILASDYYDAADYIRDYAEFLREVRV